MPHYAISMADGSVAIMQTAGKVTPDECLAKWHPDKLAKVKAHQPIDPKHIPADRTYRMAWILVDGKIEHDMPKAREMQRARLRAERIPLFADLDVEHLRADELGDVSTIADVAKQKWALRNVTEHPAIEAAATVDDLKRLDLATLLKG